MAKTPTSAIAAATGIGRPQRRDAADDDERQRDAEFDEGQVDAADAEQEADRHHADEAQRHQPQRAAAEHEGEDADRDHGEDVVEAADRVHEAMQEARRCRHARYGRRRRSAGR